MIYLKDLNIGTVIKYVLPDRGDAVIVAIKVSNTQWKVLSKSPQTSVIKYKLFDKNLFTQNSTEDNSDNIKELEILKLGQLIYG